MHANSLEPTPLSVAARGIGFYFYFFYFSFSVSDFFFFLTKGISPQINTLYRLFKNHTSNPLIYNSAAICPGRELAGMMH